jgi:acyl-CoA synthetase (AMP-forming)/AMP-acid ligase II
VLYGHPAVHQAAVFGLPSRVMGELVAAAVTLRPDAGSQARPGQGLWGSRPRVAVRLVFREVQSCSLGEYCYF